MRHSLALAGALLLGLIAVAHARDDGRYAQSPHKQWFESLKNENNNFCCDGADGQRIEDPDWGMDGIGYWVRLNGERYEIDPKYLVKVRNIVGYAIVWPYLLNGQTLIRCFLPGSGS